MNPDDPFWDDFFHALAFQAFVTLAREQGGWPDSERVRQLAYQWYESHLKEKNSAKSDGDAVI